MNTKSITVPTLNHLHTCMQPILSPHVTYFHIFTTVNANSATLHSSVHNLSCPPILYLSLPYHSLPFSHRAVRPTFPPPNILKAAQNRETLIASVFNLLLLSVPRFYSLPRRNTSLPGSSKKPFQCREERVLCRGLPMLRLPRQAAVQKLCGTGSSYLPPLLSRRLHLRKAA